MHPELQILARNALKARLAECSDAQQLVFKRMYANGALETPINHVVDNMYPDMLGWALEQVTATIAKNVKRELDFLKALDIVRP